MACGEGYGADVLARSAASVVGVDANPEAHEHARLRYTRANLRYARDLVDRFSEPADAIVFLQTIEHLQDPGAVLEHFRSLVGERGAVFVSTPNVLTLAPRGAARSDNPWHVHEYRRAEFEQLCRAHFKTVELYGLFHARKLRVHELALRLGWDTVHARLGLTRRFYDWFTPAIAAWDFAPARRPPTPTWTGPSTSSRCAGRERRAAIAARSRSSCTRTCPTSRASARGRSARSGCGRRSPAATCRCSSCSTRALR